MVLFLTIIAVVALAIGFILERVTRKSFAPYARRPYATEEWVRRFQNTGPQEVIDFLRVFADAFAIGIKHALKFRPDDLLMDVHRALNPPDWTFGDLAERQCFAILLKRRYRIALEAIWHDKITLGEIFAATRPGYPADAA